MLNQLGRYEVLNEIAGGGMAVVYAGRAREDPAQLVALKVIRSQHAHDKAFIDMFVDEAKISARLMHPSVARVHELGHDGGNYFLAMELLLGQNLATIASVAEQKGVPLPFDDIAWICARIADGLHYAHTLEAEEIVHRDVNPSNVIVTYEGRPKIIDFGLARAADRITSTAHGIIKGKLAYLSPEQATGKKDVDRRTDVFALGITLWELTTGKRLFKADDDVSTLRRAQACEVREPSSLREGYPAELERIVMRALMRNPADRWQSAGDLARALDGFVAERAGEATTAALLATLFPPERAREAWERAIESAFRNAAPKEGILAWDDDAKKMTFLQLDGGTREISSNAAVDLAEMLERRAKSDDALTASRAHVELAVIAEVGGDRAVAASRAKQALEKDPKCVAAHWIARRALHTREKPLAVLDHLDAEIEAAPNDAARADLQGERARLLWAAGEPRKKIIAAWERALALRTNDPAALAGLDSAFTTGGTQAAPKLAAHLALLAEALSMEPKLAAWLYVEQANVLGRLEDREGATRALERALQLDAGVGPVRDACVRDAVVQRSHGTLVSLLDEQANLEKDASVAAALELEAACVARHAMNDARRAESLLARAAARNPSGLLARATLGELVEIYEGLGDWTKARIARERRLPLLPENAQRAELARMATLAERAGDSEMAISDWERALSADRENERAFDALERLLASNSERTETLFANQAAHTRDPSLRATRLVRAATIAREHGRLPQAVGYLRAAVASAPDDVEAAARLSELLAGTPTEAAAADVRARVAVYARAADLASEPDVAVAWLERMAILQEEVAGDAASARATYAEIRRRDPKRRSAIMGLARLAARAGDAEAFAAATLDEAALASNEHARTSAQLRAAHSLARIDGERALRLLNAMLDERPKDDAARALVVRIHEHAGRFGEAFTARAAHIEHTSDSRAKAALLVAQAETHRVHLGDVAGALASMREAFAIDPNDSALANEIATLLADDPKRLSQWLVKMAEVAQGEDRALTLVRAAEIDELVLRDDAAASEAYEKACVAAPQEAWIAARRDHVRARVTAEETSTPTDAESTAALRKAVTSARERDAMPVLANALERLLGVLRSDRARLVALWEQAAGIEWKLPESGSCEVYERILEHAASDRAALDALLRRAPDAATAIRALVGLLSHAPDESTHLAMLLELASLLEKSGDVGGALARYREALRVDGRSPTAVLATARIADRLRDTDASIEAWCARADLTEDGASRAAFLLRAAGPLALRRDDAARERAASMLERALEADATSVAAAAALVSLLQSEQPDRLIVALRSALARTDRPDAIVMLGMELAHAASTREADRPIMTSALERVRDAAPHHGAALLALAEAYAADRAFERAIHTFQAAAEHTRDVASKKRALLALAELHDRVSRSAPDALRALRAACHVDPHDAKLARALVERLRASGREPAVLAEIAEHTERLARSETTAEARSAAYFELFDASTALGDRERAERALVSAVAESPSAESLARLAAICAPPPAGAAEHARVLGLVVARAAEIRRPSAAPFGALAVLEIDSLDRIHEGVAHAKTAIALAPSSHEARGALVRGLSRVGQHEEAIATALPMFERDAESLLALPRPEGVLDAFETSLQASRRDQEALVIRELRTIGGGASDAVAVGLRARRLPPAIETGHAAIDHATLWQRVLPAEGRSVFLDVAVALAGASAAIFPSELDSNGAQLRGNAPIGHPLAPVFARLTAQLGHSGIELFVSDAVRVPRAVHGAYPVVVAPSGLATAPEPVQIAALARPLVRMALGMPWIDRTRSDRIRAMLVAAARTVSPRLGVDANDRDLEALVADVSKFLGRSINRTHKKALAALQARLDETRVPTLDDVRALVRCVSRAELRVAFLLTGDLLATFDDLRATDGDYARVASTPGPAALAATLRHPLAGDTVRFALTESATAIRRSAGAVWTGAALPALV